MTKLFMKKQTMINLGTSQVHYKPNPGTMIIFPGYVPHQFALADVGLEPLDLYILILRLLKQQYPKKIALKMLNIRNFTSYSCKKNSICP